ncbi:hypothetical protein [Acinetobacter brisouii]|uniref:hypothetical protein n=1 Tax=Acinetobacter brisouii TaxID=396323 RepID=UPI00124F45E0|nr:hypothetical protein [Acinetobacter brisouii]
MQIAHATTEQAANEIIEQYGRFCSMADGDMMILCQGQVILEAVVFEQFEAVEGQSIKTITTRACIYQYASDEVNNFGDTVGFDLHNGDADFVSLTVFDNANEAKMYMLKVASESMMLNLH